MKLPPLKPYFTKFPFALATYALILGVAGLIICNWGDIIARFQ